MNTAEIPANDDQSEMASIAEIAAALKRHCYDSDSEIEIDEPARVSRGDDGFWVQAWVWVPNL